MQSSSLTIGMKSVNFNFSNLVASMKSISDSKENHFKAIEAGLTTIKTLSDFFSSLEEPKMKEWVGYNQDIPLVKKNLTVLRETLITVIFIQTQGKINLNNPIYAELNPQVAEEVIIKKKSLGYNVLAYSILSEFEKLITNKANKIFNDLEAFIKQLKSEAIPLQASDHLTLHSKPCLSGIIPHPCKDDEEIRSIESFTRQLSLEEKKGIQDLKEKIDINRDLIGKMTSVFQVYKFGFSLR